MITNITKFRPQALAWISIWQSSLCALKQISSSPIPVSILYKMQWEWSYIICVIYESKIDSVTIFFIDFVLGCNDKEDTNH